MSCCLVACSLIGGAGCERVLGFFSEPKAQVDAPQRYEKDGVSFEYPGNWTVKEETAQENGIELRTINVESAGNALLMVQSFQPAVEIDLAQHIELTMGAMQEEVGKQVGGLADSTRGAVTDFEREFLGAKRSGKQAAITITALGEKVPSSVALIGAVLEDRTVLLFTTIPDEDRESVEAGFDQVISSLRLGAAKPG
ncbi:hypothetical protein [Nannocystis sp.]|uniref:hypothetical protein n=1 Tax=Nannocystis sp. TaxID=1962667 RepID=UPI002420C891|nr:hypothetical protein [Nannocystis sp.]MBK7825366.1 hypothetical protein [Nannocystis sp.]MBK9757018.1 hypothetical protein [Nannocystis sp.]